MPLTKSQEAKRLAWKAASEAADAAAYEAEYVFRNATNKALFAASMPVYEGTKSWNDARSFYVQAAKAAAKAAKDAAKAAKAARLYSRQYT